MPAGEPCRGRGLELQACNLNFMAGLSGFVSIHLSITRDWPYTELNNSTPTTWFTMSVANQGNIGLAVSVDVSKLKGNICNTLYASQYIYGTVHRILQVV